MTLDSFPRNKRKKRSRKQRTLPLGTVGDVLVDAVGDGPVTGIGRDRVWVLEITVRVELGRWEVGHCGQVEFSEPLLDKGGVSRGDLVDGWVSVGKSAIEGRDGEERRCSGLGSGRC